MRSGPLQSRVAPLTGRIDTLNRVMEQFRRDRYPTDAPWAARTNLRPPWAMRGIDAIYNTLDRLEHEIAPD